MLLFILADDDLLTTLGRIAALVLIIYVFLFAVFFFVASLLLLYGNAWIRDKIGLLHQLRVIVENVDTTIDSQGKEVLPASSESYKRLDQALQAIHVVQSVHVVEIAKNTQKQVDSIEKRVEPVADRIADGVIEIRARTVMVQGMLKAFFLPGLIKLKPRDPLLLPEAPTTDRSVINEIPVSGSRLPEVSSNVVVTQLNPPDEVVHPTIMRAPDQLQSVGTEQSDNAPGH
jgi:hypothetical protein